MPDREDALPGRAEPITIAEPHHVNGAALTPPWPDGARTAVFGLGCFWGAEKDFWQTDGVITTAVGYAGGFTPNPTYEEVCSGRTGHAEAVEVVYDPEVVGYERLLEVFWQNIDPTDGGGQFADRGSQYRTAIFTLDDEQRRQAEASKAALDASGRFERPVATTIVPATRFYPAEDYHQGYAEQNPMRYGYYRIGSGRDHFLDKLWGNERTKK